MMCYYLNVQFQGQMVNNVLNHFFDFHGSGLEGNCYSRIFEIQANMLARTLSHQNCKEWEANMPFCSSP